MCSILIPSASFPFSAITTSRRFAQFVTDLDLRSTAYAFLLTVRGTPQLYSGDEIAMPGGDDPDNRRDFPGDFLGDPENAFDPTARTSDQAGLFNWIAQLAALRTKDPTLACGAQQTLLADQDSFVYTRYSANGCDGGASPGSSPSVIVALHRGSATDVQIDLKDTAVSGCVARALLPVTEPNRDRSGNNIITLHLSAQPQMFVCK